MTRFILVVLAFNSLLAFSQGPYAPAAGTPGSTAIYKDSAAIVGWADFCSVQRGFKDISNKGLGLASFGMPSDAAGMANGGSVSLGDSGIAILEFSDPLYDGPGPDFAVFENSFSDTFLELAQVSVSSNGTDFYTFPPHSLTPDTGNIGGFGSTDPTNLHNLAGKYRGQYGTPFDLSEMSGATGLDVNHITHIRLIDVVGTVDSNFSVVDTAGNKIVDPYPTPFSSGGFDLDAVGVLNSISTTGIVEHDRRIRIYPNPATDYLTISGHRNVSYRIFDLSGKLMGGGFTESQIDVSGLVPGMYSIHFTRGDQTYYEKFVKT